MASIAVIKGIVLQHNRLDVSSKQKPLCHVGQSNQVSSITSCMHMLLTQCLTLVTVSPNQVDDYVMVPILHIKRQLAT